LNPRTESLLWIQLLGLAVLPLEALLILLVLAGSSPGPAPLVEEVLCWSLGAIAPALVLWRTPADVWSLLLVQIPARGRRDGQLRLSRLQATLPLKLLGLGLGAGALLLLLIRLDQRAAIAAPLWQLNHLPRLVALLLAALLLSLMLWQWQQVVQALWLLGRSEARLRSTAPLGPEELAQTRLSLGVPLLLPAPLVFGSPRSNDPKGASPTAAEARPEGGNDLEEGSAVGGQSPPIDPEQPTTDGQGHQLDEPVG
jgi:hypothetical protein